MVNNLEKWLDGGVIFGIGRERPGDLQAEDGLAAFRPGAAWLPSSPGQVLLAWGKKKRGQHPFENNAPSFYFPDYFLTDPMPWVQYECHQEISIESLISQLASVAEAPSLTVVSRLKWQPFCKMFFEETFDELQREIKEGRLSKAVPFIVETASASMQRGQLVRSLTKALRYIEAHPVYLYGFWDQTEGILGVSPEILFEYDERGNLKTMACAGTRPIEDEDSHLLSDSKELHEHELVVKGIVSSLTPYGSISIGDRKLLKLSKLMHLVTPIEARLDRPAQFADLVRALHPTPAVGAFPKKQGTIWLEKYQQKIHRGRFGAPAGYCTANRNKGHCCVAIRNIQWTSQEIQVTAGCGIVAESQCEREWEELQLKLNTIKEMLAL